jgi:RimJ/RimL family protein N-acetyltransferase
VRVRIEAPRVTDVRAATRDPDATSARDYLGESITGSTVRYFSVLADDELVGEIFLHDIGSGRLDSALVGYVLFESKFRGQGIGSQALALLVKRVLRESSLNELVVITDASNTASRRIAEKNGFVPVGAPREDPTGICLIWSRSVAQ